MKRGALLLLAVLAFVACGPSPDSDWKELSEESEAFTVEAPGTPKKEDVQEDVPKLGSVSVRQYQWKTPSDRFYLVMYMTFPASASSNFDLSKAVRGMIDGIVRRSKGSIVSEKTITMSGLPTLESEVKMGITPGRLLVRTIQRQDRIYLLAAGWPEGKEWPGDRDRFFDSFRLK